jgi:hypothetical protein
MLDHRYDGGYFTKKAGTVASETTVPALLTLKKGL